MLERDIDTLTQALTNYLMEYRHTENLTVILGQRLLSDLLYLTHQWMVVKDMAKKFEYLELVEEFLLHCGRLGEAVIVIV
jgi:hypothetical protein